MKPECHASVTQPKTIGEEPLGRIAVVIPAYNESSVIGSTIDALQSIPRPLEVVVVDDGSTDDTAALAESRGVRVIRLSRRRGKGGALRLALKCLGMESFDAFLLIDADLGTEARKTELLLNALMSGQGDMVVGGVTTLGGTGGFGLVSSMARRLIKQLTGIKMVWPLSGQRAIKSTVWSSLDTNAPGFGFEVALTVDAAKAGFRIVEVETGITLSGSGKSARGYLHRGRQLIHIMRAIIPRLIH